MQKHSLWHCILLLGIALLANTCSVAETEKPPHGTPFPVRWTKQVSLSTNILDVVKLLDSQSVLPDGENLTLYTGDEDERGRNIITGNDWLAAIADGLGPRTTYEVAMESWFIHSSGTRILIRSAEPSTKSFVKDFQFADKSLLHKLPCQLHPRWREFLPPGLNTAAVRDVQDTVTFGELFPNAAVSNISPYCIEIVQWTTEEGGLRLLLDMVAWGDFDGDGFEDILCEAAEYYLGGSGRRYYHLLLTQTTKTGPLVLRDSPHYCSTPQNGEDDEN